MSNGDLLSRADTFSLSATVYKLMVVSQKLIYGKQLHDLHQWLPGSKMG
jgi:hypothetical protein